MPQDQGAPVRLGRVVGVLGLAGWVKVESYTRQREDLLQYERWQLLLKDEWRSLRLLDGRIQGRSLVAKLEGVDSRDLAQAIIGADIAVDREALEPLEEGEFYWAELEGLRVVTVSGEEVGRVHHLIETGANDVMVVDRAGGQGEILIPYIRSAVQQVDLAAGVIRVDWEVD